MALSLVLALTLPPFSIILPRFINHNPRLVVLALMLVPVLVLVLVLVVVLLRLPLAFL